MNKPLQVVNVTQPAEPVLCADVGQLVPYKEKTGPAGIQVTVEVTLKSLKFVLQCELTVSSTGDINNDKS